MRIGSIAIFITMVLLVVGARVLPHPPNFTPLMAVAIFSGALFRGRWMGYLIPLGAMILSDWIIGFHDLSLMVYVSMVPAVWLASRFASDVKPVGEKRSFFGLKWMGLGLGSDLIFFVASNFAVWGLSGYYARTAQGLLECFVLALPFLLNQLLGTGTFLGLLLFTWYGLKVLMQWRSAEVSYQRYKS